MTTEDLRNLLLKNSEYLNHEFKRLFFGRGNYYKNYSYLTVDSINDILFICFYEQIDDEIFNNLKDVFLEIFEKRDFKRLIIQKRYLKDDLYEVLKGQVEEKEILYENDLKFLIDFKYQNIGFFPDMKIGREFIRDISKDKNVLNLFSYTCSFSVYANDGCAKQVVNVDMSKQALNKGKENHLLNAIDIKTTKFLPFNILKSWSKIKKFAPYDVIVIDPPSFQKGSFVATKDYEKILKRLVTLANDECIVLACLNAPELDENYLKDLFIEFAPEFSFEKRLEIMNDFPTDDKQKVLKNLVFKRKK